MNREGELRKEEIESDLQSNDLSTIDAIEKHSLKQLDKLGKKRDELLLDNELIDEAKELTAKRHKKSKIN